MLTLGIDTSNYATSLAVFDTQAQEVVCAVKRFLPVKPGERGLRQSDAVFHHTAALPEMLNEVAGQADFSRVGAVGVSERPRPVEGSYMPCFLTGLSAATAFAYGAGIPLVRTTHQQGHVTAAVFAAVDWKMVVSASFLAGVLSLLTSIAGLPEVKMEATDGYGK